MDIKFYRCPICGQIIEVIRETEAPLVCCGKPMELLTAGSVDASHEKHVPVITVCGTKVCVEIGETQHPMIQKHYIEWIEIVTLEGTQRRYLYPADTPAADFFLSPSDRLLCAYAYCNLHGLWKAESPTPDKCREGG